MKTVVLVYGMCVAVMFPAGGTLMMVNARKYFDHPDFWLYAFSSLMIVYGFFRGYLFLRSNFSKWGKISGN